MTKALRFIVVVLLTGCFAVLSSQVSQREDTSTYVLGPDDQIKIWALGLEQLSDKNVRVEPNGDIDLPIYGKIRAEGLTLDQLKAELVKRFSQDVLNPEVSIEIVEFGSQPVSVMGSVNRPGIVQLHGHKTLLEVVSMAEGMRPDAGPRINISRPVQYGEIPLPNAKNDPSGRFSVADVVVKDLLEGKNPAANILISPHDTITVPRAEAVYVMGAVHKPGEVPLKDNVGISVLQALASAEGLGATPAPGNARIVRLVPGTSERKEIPVDLTKVQAGSAEDLTMRPNDILVVPTSGPKKAAARAVEAAIQTVTGIAIWGRY